MHIVLVPTTGLSVLSIRLQMTAVEYSFLTAYRMNLERVDLGYLEGIAIGEGQYGCQVIVS